MPLRHVCAVALILLTPLTANAGEPVEQQITCPVGEESFTITGTSSCSTLGRTMSFRPVTSCDFITRLPVCPSNGLPVFDRFSDAEIERLGIFLPEPEFDRLRDMPKWQRSFHIANRIGRQNSPTTFRLLLNALWFEPDTFLENAELTGELLQQMSAEKSRVSAENHPFLDAIAAWVLGATGRRERAHQKLARLRANPATPELLTPYMVRLEACLSDWQETTCGPDAPLPEN